MVGLLLIFVLQNNAILKLLYYSKPYSCNINEMAIMENYFFHIHFGQLVHLQEH